MLIIINMLHTKLSNGLSKLKCGNKLLHISVCRLSLTKINDRGFVITLKITLKETRGHLMEIQGEQRGRNKPWIEKKESESERASERLSE